MAEQQRIPLDSLGAQELNEVQQQLEAESQNLMQGLLALQQSAAKFAAAGQAVEYLQEQKQGADAARRRGRRWAGRGWAGLTGGGGGQ